MIEKGIPVVKKLLAFEPFLRRRDPGPCHLPKTGRGHRPEKGPIFTI
jgi:hypothetical protein